MYNIVEDVSKAERLVIIDFTKFSGKEAYFDTNTRTINFNINSIEYKRSRFGTWKNLRRDSAAEEPGGTAVFRCPGEFEGNLLIYSDYGNHEGGVSKKDFPEEILFPGLMLGDDSVCYFEDCISVCYRLGPSIMIYKLSNEILTEDQLWSPNRKRPTNLLYCHDDVNPHVLISMGEVGKWDIPVPIEISTVTSIDWLCWVLRI